MADSAQNLRDWRRSKDWTQTELGDRLGITQKAYSAYETGRNEVPGDVQKKLRRLGYEGPWPEEVEGGVTREDLQALGRDVIASVGHAQKTLEAQMKRLAGLVDALQSRLPPPPESSPAPRSRPL